MESYAKIKIVMNQCPQCGKAERYRLRFKYPDEGKMTCTQCKQEGEESLTSADIALTQTEVNMLHEALQGYIHYEKNCAGSVSVEYQNLQTKLEEYLHG